MFDMKGRNVVVLGGGGVLGKELALGFARAGCNIAVCDLLEDAAQNCATEASQLGVIAKAWYLDATNPKQVEQCCQSILATFQHIHVLVNCVGGNQKAASTDLHTSFFDLPIEALKKVVDLNLFAGAITPSIVFGKYMAMQDVPSSILNISSMNAYRPLTRIPGYAAAKAAVSNFTQWLAVDMAQKYGDKIRVNALAPGFFMTTQSRFLLYDETTGGYSARGKRVIEQTPMGKFGEPSDLVGAAVFLSSDEAKFVTGVVLPVDGGFSCYSGV